jgi:hypothetical protein
MSPSQTGIVVNRGPFEIDVPRSAGYYGGIAVALGLGMIEWPIAVFIGAIPVLKMLTRGDLPKRVQFVGHVFDGAAKPVGGDAEGTIRLTRTPAGVRRVTAGKTTGTATRRRKASPRKRSAPSS